MRRWLLLLVVGCSASESKPPPADTPLKIDPRPAPAFTLLDTEGRELSVEDLRGKIVILNFWAAWCAACDGDLQILGRVQERHPEIQVVGISYQSGARDQVSEFGRRLKVQFPLLIGTRDVIDRYGVATYPTTFILDRDGRMRFCVFNSRTEEFWDELLRQVP